MIQIPYVPGEFYHIYNRANGSDLIFTQRRNYSFFLHKFCRYLDRAFDTFAYCLLPNHFHLIVRCKGEGEVEDVWHKTEKFALNKEYFVYSDYISALMKSFLSSYVQSFNRQEGRRGSLLMKNTRRKHINNPSQGTKLHAQNLPYKTHTKTQNNTQKTNSPMHF